MKQRISDYKRRKESRWVTEANLDGYMQQVAEYAEMVEDLLRIIDEAYASRNPLWNFTLEPAVVYAREHLEHVRECKKGSCATELLLLKRKVPLESYVE